MIGNFDAVRQRSTGESGELRDTHLMAALGGIPQHEKGPNLAMEEMMGYRAHGGRHEKVVMISQRSAGPLMAIIFCHPHPSHKSAQPGPPISRFALTPC